MGDVPRERLRDLAVEKLEADARRAAASDDVDRSWRAARAAWSIDPLCDSLVRAMIEIHRAKGNATAALRAYHVLYRDLREELGVEPSEATTALVARMLGSPYW